VSTVELDVLGQDENGKVIRGFAAGCDDCREWVSPHPRATAEQAQEDAIRHDAEKHGAHPGYSLENR
jgi:hypothetical protein